MQLSNTTLKQLANNIILPNYNRNTTNIGIVHIGPGAFFRAHQAWYTEQALNKQGGNWGICAVALNSNNVKNQLAPQQGLYTLVELDQSVTTSVIGCVKEVLAYQEDFDKVLNRLSAASTKLVTLTITEKGYYLNGNGQLDTNASTIQTDIDNPERPQSAIGLLVLACQKRQQQQLAPLSIISCDNVSDNGKKLKNALVAYAKHIDSELADIIEQTVICPCTMVDSITPATNKSLAEELTEKYHYHDNWPIKREAFTQWVIEDILPDDIPDWRNVGVTFTQDVSAYENAKLRVLNATHSTLAYLGCLLSIETVYQAINEPVLHAFIDKMLTTEIQPSFSVPAEMNFADYSQSIIQRYHNPEIKHLLAQIAWDGSQKLPMRILPVITTNLANNHPITACCFTLAAWMRFIVKKSRDGSELVDPIKAQLINIGQRCTDEAQQDVLHFLSLTMFAALVSNKAFITELTRCYQVLAENNATDVLNRLVDY